MAPGHGERLGEAQVECLVGDVLFRIEDARAIEDDAVVIEADVAERGAGGERQRARQGEIEGQANDARADEPRCRCRAYPGDETAAEEGGRGESPAGAARGTPCAGAGAEQGEEAR